jgi:ribosome maturation factor RimP
MKGNAIVPFFFVRNLRISSLEMDYAIQQKSIESFIENFLKDSPDTFLVELSIKPGNNISVFIDADNGLNIDKCTKLNRALYKYLEESNLFPNNDYSLEVSSPGLEEPLKLLRQYQKNIGRLVEVEMNDGSRKEGKLLSANEEEVEIEQTQGKGKKAVTIIIKIKFDQIKHTKVLVTF